MKMSKQEKMERQLRVLQRKLALSKAKQALIGKCKSLVGEIQAADANFSSELYFWEEIKRLETEKVELISNYANSLRGDLAEEPADE